MILRKNTLINGTTLVNLICSLNIPLKIPYFLSSAKFKTTNKTENRSKRRTNFYRKNISLRLIKFANEDFNAKADFRSQTKKIIIIRRNTMTGSMVNNSMIIL